MDNNMKTINVTERTKVNGRLLTALVVITTVLSVLTFIIALSILLGACTDANDPDGPGSARTPLTANATLPATAGGTLTRNATTTRILGTGLSDLTLYYPAADDALSIYNVASADVTMGADAKSFSFLTTQGSFGTATTPAPLYWQQIAGKGLTEQQFYLTVKQTERLNDIISAGILNTASSLFQDDNVLWATATSTAGANADADRPALAFGALKSRFARLTLIINCKGCQLKSNLLKAYIYTLPEADEATANAADATAKTNATGIYRQAWPTIGTDPTEKALIDPAKAVSSTGTSFSTHIGSHLIAPQALPAIGNSGVNKQLLTIRYNMDDTTDASEPKHEWTLDLSQVPVSRTGDSEFVRQPTTGATGYAYGNAFGYNPGEQITLTVSLSLMNLAPGEVQSQIDSYQATADTDFGNIDVPLTAGTASPEGGNQPGVSLVLNHPVITISGMGATTTTRNGSTISADGISAIDLYVDMLTPAGTATQSSHYTYNGGSWSTAPGTAPITVHGGTGNYRMRAAAAVTLAGGAPTIYVCYTGMGIVAGSTTGTFSFDEHLAPYTAAVKVVLKDADGQELDSSSNYTTTLLGMSATTGFIMSDDGKVNWTTTAPFHPEYTTTAISPIQAAANGSTTFYNLVPGTLGDDTGIFSISRQSGGSAINVASTKSYPLDAGKLYTFSLTLNGDKRVNITKIDITEFDTAKKDDGTDDDDIIEIGN